eukprot:scaffold25669_cov69-Skeletonema_dohrnii-CCMP3373.AAC.2
MSNRDDIYWRWLRRMVAKQQKIMMRWKMRCGFKKVRSEGEIVTFGICALSVVNKIHTPPSQPNLHTKSSRKVGVLSGWCSDGDGIVQGSGEENILTTSLEEGGIIMADVVQEDDEIFVYMGGDQVVPRNVRRVRIDKSVKFIAMEAFTGRHNLIYVEFHDGVERIEEFAFPGCTSLRSIKSLGVVIIEGGAFNGCENLEDVEFNSLETIGNYAFMNCTSLRNITMPSLKIIGFSVFDRCEKLLDLDLPEGLETIQERAFQSCERLRRIAVPMKDELIDF